MTDDEEYLDRAIDYYGKGFKVRGDYYNGENYALCLDMKAKKETVSEEKVYLRIEAKKTRERIIEILINITEDDIDIRPDRKWIYATLSTCFLALGKTDMAEKYKDKFGNEKVERWEIDTFEESQEIILSLLDV